MGQCYCWRSILLWLTALCASFTGCTVNAAAATAATGSSNSGNVNDVKRADGEHQSNVVNACSGDLKRLCDEPKNFSDDYLEQYECLTQNIDALSPFCHDALNEYADEYQDEHSLMSLHDNPNFEYSSNEDYVVHSGETSELESSNGDMLATLALAHSAAIVIGAAIGSVAFLFAIGMVCVFVYRRLSVASREDDLERGGLDDDEPASTKLRIFVEPPSNAHSASRQPNPVMLNTLLGMGFSYERSITALKATNNSSIEDAVNHIERFADLPAMPLGYHFPQLRAHQI